MFSYERGTPVPPSGSRSPPPLCLAHGTHAPALPHSTLTPHCPHHRLNAPPLEPSVATGPLKDYRGTSLTKTRPTPWDHHRALGVGLLQGPRVGRFIMSEVPLYSRTGLGNASLDSCAPLPSPPPQCPPLETFLATGLAPRLLSGDTTPCRTTGVTLHSHIRYRGASLVRNHLPLGSYCRPMPRVLGGS